MTFIDYAAIVGCATLAGAALMVLRFLANELLRTMEYRRLARALNLERRQRR